MSAQRKTRIQSDKRSRNLDHGFRHANIVLRVVAYDRESGLPLAHGGWVRRVRRRRSCAHTSRNASRPAGHADRSALRRSSRRPAMKRWLWLGLGALVLGMLMSGFMRWQASLPREDVTQAVALPRVDVEAELTPDGLVPYRIQVPKDREVHLVVRVAPKAKEGSLVLLGYEDILEPVYLGPGEARDIVFTSTRPGDDFALSMEGTVVGRLEVTGSHLEEGHQ